MSTLEEIREKFSSIGVGKSLLIEKIDNDFPAYVIKTSDWFGVGIEFNYNENVSERFSNVRMRTILLNFGGEERRFLVLTSNLFDLKNEFALICVNFIEPGKKGENRLKLLSDPVSWWENWKNLLGNAVKDKVVYDIVAELLTLEKIYKRGDLVKSVWTGPYNGTHDIELPDISYEVKSSIKKYETEIIISNQYQLDNKDRKLYLVFYRMEKSLGGDSINTILKRLEYKGIDVNIIENALDKYNIELGSTKRKEKYKVLEIRKYKVDEKFPTITPSSFKNSIIPSNIKKITYTIDLEGLEYSTEI